MLGVRQRSGSNAECCTIDLRGVSEIIAQVEARHRLQPFPLCKRAGKQCVETVIDGECHDLLHRIADRSTVTRSREQHRVDGFAANSLARLIIEDAETGWHTGFEREALQQAFAEGVDRLHLQAARRFDGTREQLPRQGKFFACRLTSEQFLEDYDQCFSIARRPLRQLVEHALRHLGGGGAGEGEAEDLVRWRAGKQQLEHAHFQHVRFTCASIRTHPRGCLRVGGHLLCAFGDVEKLARITHRRLPRPSRHPAILSRAPSVRSRRNGSRKRNGARRDKA